MTGAKRKAAPAPAPGGGDDGAAVRIQYSCDYCFRDITDVVRIQCAECGREAGGASAAAGETPPEEVDLCVECFAAGVEFGCHRAGHAYRVLRPLGFAVFSRAWCADEEILLLEAVEAHGVGNWGDVAEQLGGRAPDEVAAHYAATYMRRDVVCGAADYGAGVPGLLPPEEIAASEREAREQRRPKRPRVAQAEPGATPQSVPACHEVAGYMPHRGEFETEAENDAEAAVKDVVFAEPPDDPEDAADAALKLTVLEMYGAVLERRAARRALAVERGLVEHRRAAQTERVRPRDERELLAQLRPYARFLSPADMQTLLDGLVREEELRRQVAHLQALRRAGVRRFADVPAYDADRRLLEAFLRSAKSSSAASASAGAGPSSTGGGSNGASNPTPNTTASTTPNGTAPASGGQREPHALPSAGAGTLHAPAAAARASLASLDPGRGCDLPAVPPAPLPGRRSASPLDIASADGVELLSPGERALCAALRLWPRAYLGAKDALLREAARTGGALRRAQARAALKIDVNKTSRLYDYFVAAGWISPPLSGE